MWGYKHTVAPNKTYALAPHLIKTEVYSPEATGPKEIQELDRVKRRKLIWNSSLETHKCTSFQLLCSGDLDDPQMFCLNNKANSV